MNILIMILLISFLVMIHETGHFLVAKAFGIKVDKFGFGLPVGPTLFSKKIGETEFIVHALLLGGYVAFPDDDKENKKNSEGRFDSKPVYQRLIVVSAGVIANFFCAIFLVLFCAGVWHKLPSGTYETSIAEIIPQAVVSLKNSGMQKGDVLYEINGSDASNPLALSKYLAESKAYDDFISEEDVHAKTIEFLELNPELKGKNLIPAGFTVKLPKPHIEKKVELTEDGIIGFEKPVKTQVELTEFQKSIRAMLPNHDVIEFPFNLKIEDLTRALCDGEKPLYITVLRNGEKIKLAPVYPDYNGGIGIKKIIKENMYIVKTPVDALKYSVIYLKRNSDLMLYGLYKMFTGKVPMEDMHGIIAITKIGGDIIKYNGLFKGLLLTAIISLNLAYLNLLPIPALDGGHIMFMLIEKITGKPVDEKVVTIISEIFFNLLIIFMIIIIVNDILAIIASKI